MARAICIGISVLFAAMFAACCCGPPSGAGSTTQSRGSDAVTIYAPTSNIACATDPNFLDSSPLISPANFAMVSAGTEVVIVDIGGVFSGKMYYGLSAGSRMTVYVYRDIFEQRFVAVGTLGGEDESNERDEEPVIEASNPEPEPEAPKEDEPPPPEKFQARTWHSGSHSAEAVFVRMANGKVTIKRADNGKEVTIEMDKLSDDDQQYVKSLRH